MKGNLSKKIKKITILLGALYTLQLGANNLMSNREYISSNYHSIKGADGAFNQTKFSRYHDGDYKNDEVYQFRLFGSSRVMTDGGMYGENDGLVDRIYIMSSIFSKFTGTITREKNYEEFKDEFEKADKVLADIKKRFAK